MVRCERDEAVDGSDIGRGLVNGLLIALPLWVILGVVLALVFQHGPMGETSSAVLMIAAVCEAILLRPHVRTLWKRILRYADFRRADPGRNTGGRRTRSARRVLGAPDTLRSAFERTAGRIFESIEDLLRYVKQKSAPSNQARPVVAPHALFRQSLALSALVGAYLQYYFLEVNLQIASMHSLTVFVPVTSMT